MVLNGIAIATNHNYHTQKSQKIPHPRGTSLEDFTGPHASPKASCARIAWHILGITAIKDPVIKGLCSCVNRGANIKITEHTSRLQSKHQDYRAGTLTDRLAQQEESVTAYVALRTHVHHLDIIWASSGRHWRLIKGTTESGTEKVTSYCAPHIQAYSSMDAMKHEL